MIVRSRGAGLLLITQPDHAALAGTIIEAWRGDGLAASPQRGAILLATRAHDDGWLEEDRAPLVDAASGEVLDFLHAPDDLRYRVWPRSVERLRAAPYAAALVAEHALSLHEQHRADPGWHAFFETLEELRARSLAAAGPLTADDLRRDYVFLRLGDLLSLAFCNGWTGPQRHADYEAQLDAGRLRVAPDPFGGREVPLAVAARALPRRRFASAREAAEAYAAAPTLVLTGTAAGS